MLRRGPLILYYSICIDCKKNVDNNYQFKAWRVVVPILLKKFIEKVLCLGVGWEQGVDNCPLYPLVDSALNTVYMYSSTDCMDSFWSLPLPSLEEIICNLKQCESWVKSKTNARVCVCVCFLYFFYLTFNSDSLRKTECFVSSVTNVVYAWIFNIGVPWGVVKGVQSRFISNWISIIFLVNDIYIYVFTVHSQYQYSSPHPLLSVGVPPPSLSQNRWP